MTRLLKVLLLLVAGVIGLGIVAAVLLFLFVDPNDFRDDVSAGVKDATGRDLVIEGDLELSVFPWLAIEMGRTRLGNAEGFGEDPFLSFDNARLSIRLLPLLLRREATVGTASIEGLAVNLEVRADGRSNWDDFAETARSQEPVPPEESGEGGGAGQAELDIEDILIADASVTYRDARTGSSYAISDLTMSTGEIAADESFDFEAGFDFAAEPDAVGGSIAIRGTTTLSDGFATIAVDGLNVAGTLRGVVPDPTGLNFDARALRVDTATESVDLGELELMVLGLAISADIEPFSYAGTPQPRMQLRVADFSLKELMRTLGTEPPATADPNALGRVAFSAAAAVGEDSMRLTSMSLELDDTTMTGELELPLSATGAIRFDLVADAINLDGYMAPAEEGVASEAQASSDDVEIPVDLIRSLNAQGTAKLERAALSGLLFENLEVGLSSAGGTLRLHPLGADLFEGSYSGDVRIDASGDVPSISVDERVADVNLSSLAQSMFGVQNVTGSIDGTFALGGRGATLDAIRRDLDGSMSFTLADGAWEGTDIWHQLRATRAVFRQEPAPEPTLPPRTEFTSVSATGTVTDGIFENDDFRAELPFLQLTGRGLVDFGTAEIDYSMQARVLEKPEFMGDVTEAELADFTAAVVPLRISGPLASPSVRPDVEEMLRREAEEVIRKKGEELRDRLLRDILGGDEEPPAEEGTEGQQEEEPTLEDALKDLFRN